MKHTDSMKSKVYISSTWQMALCLLAGLLFTAPLVDRAQAGDTAQETQTLSQESLQLDDVIVTAEKRAANVQDIPASITALDEALIEDAQIEDLTDIATFTPGLEFRNAGSRRHSFTFMRGIKKRSLPGTGNGVLCRRGSATQSLTCLTSHCSMSKGLKF